MMRASNATDELTRLTNEDILALVQTRSRHFQRQIRFRDWRELIASAFVAVMIAPAVGRGPILSRVGALVILAGLVLVAFKLWRARRFMTNSAAEVALPVAKALRVELQRIDAQITLLDGVGWWYVAPLIGGSLLLVAGSRGRAGWLFTLGYSIFAALLASAIIALNRRAVRRTLRPKREEVMRLLAQIES